MIAGDTGVLEGLLDAGIRRLKIVIPDEGMSKLVAYVNLLAKWNSAYNLTAIRDPESAVTHHILDSLSVIEHLPTGTIVDVGSGAGLPGIPIAIAEPGRRVTLNDSSQKKIAFLRQAKIELGLANVDLHAGRAEDWRPEPRFDVAISRALAQGAVFVSLARHLLKPLGCVALMKGTLPSQEMVGIADNAKCRVIKLEVPFLDAERHLVLCEYKA